MRRKKGGTAPRSTPQSVTAAIKPICEIMRRSNCAGALRIAERSDGERSWTVSRQVIEARKYDLKAVHPNAKTEQDTRTPEELLDLIEAKGKEVAEAIAELRRLTQKAGDAAQGEGSR